MDLIFWRQIKIFPSVSNSRVPCLQWHQTFTGLTIEWHFEVSQGRRSQGQWSCQGYEAPAHDLWSLKNWWLESNFVRIGSSSSYNSFSQFSCDFSQFSHVDWSSTTKSSVIRPILDIKNQLLQNYWINKDATNDTLGVILFLFVIPAR
jgi:hypothetical protein